MLTQTSSRKSSSSRPSSTKASSSKSLSNKQSSVQSVSSRSSTKQLSTSKFSSSTRVVSSQKPSSRITSSSVKTSSSSTSLRDAYQIITSQHLEAFCTKYLGLTTPSTTKTTTLSASVATTNVLEMTATSKIATTTTETDVIQTVTVTTTVRTYAATAPTRKRALETPSALSSYPERAISSACNRAATAPPTTTILKSVMVTSTSIVTSTLTTTAYEYDLSTARELATSTVTSISPLYTDAPCGNQPAGSTWSGPLWFIGQWALYCHSYSIVGVSHYSSSGDMGACMGLCNDFGWCKGVKQSDGNCWLYDDFTISPFGNSSVAVRVG
ncbi:hypothetical protein QM012_004962 [Aureobasidium pullulans]|uniref:Apple domain-containing protein n=1 Tax=Aureobasidium pullulans TaxID=5580 RepID=A0ABR0T6L9_AURPU